jgi:hypothetical protein
VFVKHTGNDKAVADPNHVLFFNANEPYRISHPVSGGDDCTSFVFSTEALVEALSQHEPTGRDHPQKPFRFTHGPIELQTIFRQQQLRRNLSDDSTRALEIEESALHLLHEVTRHVYHHRGAPLRRHRPDTLRLRRHWVESVKLLMAERPAANLSLAKIACTVSLLAFSPCAALPDIRWLVDPQIPIAPSDGAGPATLGQDTGKLNRLSFRFGLFQS